jgi:FkbM family methyltransferase
MIGELFYQPATLVQRAYYESRAGRPRDEALFRWRASSPSDFFTRYVLANEVHRRLHPFQFLRPDDVVVHVGFDRVYLHTGQSHPLVMAGLLHGSGEIVCVDPDPRNVQAMRGYADTDDIGHLHVVEGAVWKEPADLEFVFAEGWSPMSVAREVADGFPGGDAPTRGIVSKVRAAPLIDLVGPEIHRRVTYLSLTTNGAEPEILKGAADLLDRPQLRIALALAFEHFSYTIRKRVCEDLRQEGFHVTVANAPHDPWNVRPFLFAVATPEPVASLVARGFHRATWDELEGRARDEAASYARLVPFSVRRAVAPVVGMVGSWRRRLGGR